MYLSKSERGEEWLIVSGRTSIYSRLARQLALSPIEYGVSLGIAG
jgi:hypothetical protein